MTHPNFQNYQRPQRSNWIRLRTLVILRWIAIVGQITAFAVAIGLLGLNLPIGIASLVIFSSILANLFTNFIYPENKRLTEREMTIMLVFDMIQLAILLYLVGGLNNPFALLILAPVTIASTVLSLRNVMIVGVLAILTICFLSVFYIPMLTATGAVLTLPSILQFGFGIGLVTGVLFLALYARQITTEMNAMGDALVATQLALTREQNLTDLGGVVAAAAHELGTPLATIKIASAELAGELEQTPDLKEDAELISEQADRCRQILNSMGRAGKDDLQIKSALLETVLGEAAEPHLSRGKQVVIDVQSNAASNAGQPQVLRQPEIIHGLRNLIQNAVDFSEELVEINAAWTDDEITVEIIDDGPGFPASVIGKIGDPFVRRRRQAVDKANRPEYEGMGLGLFIAKTLLERSGANLLFGNVSDVGGGAKVSVAWPMDRIKASNDESGLGDNQPIVF